METQLIGIVAFCVFWSVANTYVLTRVTWLMSEVTNIIGRQTFAGIVEYEQKMASVPDEPAPATPTDDRIWNLMRRTHEEILRVRGRESSEFPWTAEQCADYWRAQELVFARQHPDLDKNAHFDSLVDRLVVGNMWANAPQDEEPAPPEQEAPRCGICGKPAVMMRPKERVWRCQEHTEFEVLYDSEPPAPTSLRPPSAAQQFPQGDCNATDGADFCDLPAGHGGAHSWAAASAVSNDQQDAFQKMIHGRHDG